MRVVYCGSHLAKTSFEMRSIALMRRKSLLFLDSHFGDVDVHKADRITLELFRRWLLAFDFRQPADAVWLRAVDWAMSAHRRIAGRSPALPFDDGLPIP